HSGRPTRGLTLRCARCATRTRRSRRWFGRVPGPGAGTRQLQPSTAVNAARAASTSTVLSLSAEPIVATGEDCDHPVAGASSARAGQEHLQRGDGPAEHRDVGRCARVAQVAGFGRVELRYPAVPTRRRGLEVTGTRAGTAPSPPRSHRRASAPPATRDGGGWRSCVQCSPQSYAASALQGAQIGRRRGLVWGVGKVWATAHFPHHKKPTGRCNLAALGAPTGTRTQTEPILSRLPLPVGLWGPLRSYGPTVPAVPARPSSRPCPTAATSSPVPCSACSPGPPRRR